MPMQLKEDVAYILLKKMGDCPNSSSPINLMPTDFVGRKTDRTEILAHIDYLNQKGYVKAEFDGDAYANEGPNPIPDSVAIKSAELTASGQELLEKMNQNPPAELQKGPSVSFIDPASRYLQTGQEC